MAFPNSPAMKCCAQCAFERPTTQQPKAYWVCDIFLTAFHFLAQLTSFQKKSFITDEAYFNRQFMWKINVNFHQARLETPYPFRQQWRGHSVRCWINVSEYDKLVFVIEESERYIFKTTTKTTAFRLNNLHAEHDFPLQLSHGWKLLKYVLVLQI